MRNVSIFQPGISGKWKARPGMFGVEDDKRGNGIHQPPWNPTAFSLLKWEVRNRHKQLGNQPRKQSRGFAVYVHEITKVWQCPGKPVNLPRG